jgi:type VI secretion system protein ImpG
VRRVRHLPAGSSAARDLPPIYGLQHVPGDTACPLAWWVQRRSSARRDLPGTRTYLSLTAPGLATGAGLLLVDALCTNRDLPSRLELGSDRDFAIEGASGLRSVRCLRHPTSARPALGSDASRWRLISHLALNHLSLSTRGEEEGAAGLAALRELLVLYDTGDSAATRTWIQGLVGLQSRDVLRPLGRGARSALVRGLEMSVEFEADHYTGGNLFLLASVLERFLALHASVNSFAQTVARVRGREGVLKRWPPRLGCRHTL